MGKHRKPKDNKVAKRAATVGAAAVSLPTLALTFSPSAHAESKSDTLSMPRVVIPAGGDAPAKCADHIVKHGETLAGIAAAYGTDLAAVEPLNPGIIAGDRPDDYSLIFAGGHVHLPDGKCDPVSPPPSPAPHPVHHRQWHHWHHHQWHHTPTPTPTPAPTPTPVGTTPVIAPDCPGTASGYCAHPVSFWGPLIEQAMALVGGNVAANHDVAGVESLMLAESSGNPNAINNYDSNAQNGDPSRGLMQTISATFNAYHVSGTSDNIYDPLANIAAALAYINAQYGGNIPSSPY